ncbi:MAG: DUF983 domain-containing protein [Alphaproteobacteria bacterium]
MNKFTGPSPSWFAAGLLCRCPRCGRGKLFGGFLKVAPRCTVCDLDLAGQDSGDGPAVFIILILGFFSVGLGIWVEVRFEPALWVTLAVVMTFTVVVGLLMLRPFKATLIALQFKHRKVDDFGQGDRSDSDGNSKP